MTKASKYIFIIVFAFLIQVFSQPVNACVEGLKWGMDLSKVETHLGVSLIPIKEKANENLFEVKDIQISGLPVEALRVRIEKESGLKQLAYEIDNENMTEVLQDYVIVLALQLEQTLILKVVHHLNNNGFGTLEKM